MNLEMASLINRDLRILRFKGAKRALVRGSLILAWTAAVLGRFGRGAADELTRSEDASGYRGQNETSPILKRALRP
jgi:hypothetical protein